MVLRWIEIYTELLERWLEVDSGLEMRDVQSFTNALDMGAQKRVGWAEDPLYRSRQLLAR